MILNWQAFNEKNAKDCTSKAYCLYVFHHPSDGDHPFYIGKAKYFGPNQADGYKGSARYNAGYQHLLMGLLRSGFTVYIAEIGKEAFELAEEYEQELIARWAPIRKQKTKNKRLDVTTIKPWITT